jgi:transposase
VKLLTVKEVADYFGTHPETVRRWIRIGRLQAVKATALSPGGSKPATRGRFKTSQSEVGVS